MEKLLKEFYEVHPIPIWWSEASQVRKFSEWATANGHDVELRFVEGKRARKLTLIWIALAILTIAFFTLGWERHRMNVFPIGFIILILLPIMSKRTPTLTKAHQGSDGNP